MYQKNAQELLQFIQRSPSCYHAVANFQAMLEEFGFHLLREEALWTLHPGEGYYTVRNGSSIIAFRVPRLDFSGFQIAASHSDSPSFKVKPKGELQAEGHYTKLNVERYGGMLCAPWLDRPLSVAGRVVVEENGTVASKLIHFDRDLLLIPNLAIHMNRKANDGVSYNAQVDMLPLLGEASEPGRFLALVGEQAGVDPAAILDTDLFLYSRTPGTIWGADGEFLSSRALDDLQCAYSTMQGFLHSENPKQVTMCCVFDNEEVGSCTKQGADSTFLRDVLERINECCGRTPQQLKAALAGSFLLSADNGHAVHPNHPETADPTNRVYMNEGVVIKYHANQKYTSDGISAGIFQAICRRAGIPTQPFTNRSDMLGGSTLGNLSNRHVSLNAVDIGLAQLAMHSPYETGGVKDTHYLIQACTAFFSTTILPDGKGGYRLAFI